MNWLTDFVRPKVKKISQKEIADNLWTKCPNCGQMLFSKELKKSMYVCTKCGHHLRLYIDKRLKMLFDNGEYNEIVIPKLKEDPLNFRDSKKYTDRLKTYRKATGNDDAIKVAQGEIGGIVCVVAIMDFSFMGGSMGTVVGEGIVKAAELAIKGNYPLITVAASGGARMQEGILSLMQMARTTAAINMVKEKGLPFISILTDPTTGGVSASFAMLGDIHIAEKGCVIGFAGARVIEQTIREKLPEGFQRAEYLKEHGMVDIVVERSQMKNELVKVISILMHQKPRLNTLAITAG
ncbi:MAG: acetyl-CoA carboxylase carboxyltransferase subunit beta [Alphaproteobacteria bacterium]|nr:acetyl-CoA carboxylase carboxyltransferase subunit beta [Alphaproteobacteria bacterium]MBQ8630141.1 acetyl-CoA carboxylase carboxyltransferase subunit beta [Alphaproteobacteria bacterium]